MTRGALTPWLALIGAILMIGSPAARAVAQQAQRPLTLADLVAAADQRNPSVIEQRRIVEAAEAAVKIEKAGLGITVTAQGSAGFSGNATAASSSFTSSTGVVASYTVYDSGLTAYTLRRAEASLTAARATLDQVRQDTALAVAQAYVTVLRTQRAVDQNQQVVAQYQALLNLAEGQFRAGVVARSDVAQAQANLAAAESDLIAARNDVDVAAAALNVALGREPATPIAVAPAPAPPRVTIAQADISRVAEQRPEVRRDQATIDAATAAVSIAQAGGGLQVALSGSVGQTFSPYGQTTYSVSGTVSFPLADGGRTSANVAQAQANLAAAKAGLESSRLLVQKQAVTALFNITTARARIASATAALAYAQASLLLAQGRYAAGVGRLLEVVDAQTTLVRAQVALDRAQFDELEGVIALRYALGRSVVDGEI
jgi:outer membrane protein